MRKRIGFSLALIFIVFAIFLYSRGQFVNGLRRPDYQPLPEYSNPSKTIKTAVDKSFVISLESNRTTGYGWEISKDLDTILLKLMEIQHQASPTTRLGAPGKDSWTFKALQPGSTTLTFEYIRPWEQEVPPVEEKSFSIVIAE